MESDCNRAKTGFINRSVDIRQQFSFAKPDQIMSMIELLCSDAYGSMLWKLSSDSSEQFFKCWNIMVKLVHGAPRSTFTYLVEGHLAAGYVSLRNQILSRYSGFFRKLLNSPSKEVRIISRIVSKESRSNTCSNLIYLQKLTVLFISQDQDCSTCQDGSRTRTVETWSSGQFDENEAGEILEC